MPGIISDLIHGGIKGIGDAAKSVIDSINAPKEEKDRANLALQSELDRHQEVLLNNASDIEKSYLADVQDARGSNVKIQESDKASWLAKNTPYIIALVIISFWIILALYIASRFLNIIKSDKPVDFSGVLGVFSGVTAIATMIVSFFFGSSQGSADKQKTIDKMATAAKNNSESTS